MSKTRTITPNPPADFVPSKNDVSYLRPFRVWCQKVLPLVYDDSLSYYELLCKVVDYLNKTMEEVNQLGVDVSNLFNAFQQLQDYVNHYFDNLDVQEEINNKLDEMFEDGRLGQILAQYLHLPITYFTTKEMLSVDNFEKGTYLVSLGYSKEGDGGGASFIVDDVATLDTLKLANNLYLKPIANVYNANVYGCDYTGENDCTKIVQYMLDNLHHVEFQDGTYKFLNKITLTRGMSIKGFYRREYLPTYIDFSECLDENYIEILDFNIQVENINILGCYQTNTVTPHYALYLKDASYVNIINVNTYYCYNGLTIIHSWGCHIERCNFRFGNALVRMIATTELGISTNNYFNNVFCFNATTHGFFCSGLVRALFECCGTDSCANGYSSNGGDQLLTFINCSFELCNENAINVMVENLAGSLRFIQCWFPDSTSINLGTDNRNLNNIVFDECDLSSIETLTFTNGKRLPCLINCNVNKTIAYTDGMYGYNQPCLITRGGRSYIKGYGLMSNNFTINFDDNNYNANGWYVRNSGLTPIEITNGIINEQCKFLFEQDNENHSLTFKPTGGMCDINIYITGNFTND